MSRVPPPYYGKLAGCLSHPTGCAWSRFAMQAKIRMSPVQPSGKLRRSQEEVVPFLRAYLAPINAVIHERCRRENGAHLATFSTPGAVACLAWDLSVFVHALSSMQRTFALLKSPLLPPIYHSYLAFGTLMEKLMSEHMALVTSHRLGQYRFPMFLIAANIDIPCGFGVC
jgi:hypothetical protein